MPKAKKANDSATAESNNLMNGSSILNESNLNDDLDIKSFDLSNGELFYLHDKMMVNKNIIG